MEVIYPFVDSSLEVDEALPASIVDYPQLRNRARILEVERMLEPTLPRLWNMLEKTLCYFAIPFGGVPIGLAISSHLYLPFDNADTTKNTCAKEA